MLFVACHILLILIQNSSIKLTFNYQDFVTTCIRQLNCKLIHNVQKHTGHFLK